MKSNNNKAMFYDMVKESLMKQKPEEMEITFRTVMKQNRKKLHGCILQLPGSAAAPTFYLEDLYPAFMNGTSADDIAESLIHYAQNNNLQALPGDIDLDDYECVKKNLGLCVLGIERNKEYLKDMIYETFEDLAVVPMIFTNDKYGPGHIKVRRDFLELWENVTEEDVLREAKENSPNLLPVTFRQLGDNLAEQEPGVGTELFVVSNAFFAGGAAVMFYPRVLECISMAIGRNLFVLPSSTNEVIVITDNGQDPMDLLRIVKEVNRTHVAQEEILSDSVYYYSRSNDRLSKVAPVLV